MLFRVIARPFHSCQSTLVVLTRRDDGAGASYRNRQSSHSDLRGQGGVINPVSSLTASREYIELFDMQPHLKSKNGCKLFNMSVFVGRSPGTSSNSQHRRLAD